MIRIVIAEDQQMMLGALGSLLNLEDDMEGSRERLIMGSK